jgi:hypothetical protein
MDIGSGLACLLGRIAARLGRPGGLVILALVVVLVVVIAGHLLRAPEPLVSAPLRWYVRM